MTKRVAPAGGGVVLGPHDNGDICQWLPHAEELATRYRVALFDWREPDREPVEPDCQGHGAD